MSPEQACGEPVDARSDLFSFGTVLYEMAVGRVPFRGESNAQIISSLLRDQPQLSGINPELEHIILKALEKDRNVRYQSAQELRADLKRLARDTTSQPAVFARKRSLPIWKYAAAVAVLAVIAAGSVLAWRTLHKQPLSVRDMIVLSEFTNTTGEAIFDDMLKQALTIQLEESPYLSILSADRVRAALAYMGKAPTERVTRDVARNICERESIKAMVNGSIGSLGSHYLVAMEAVNCATGDSLAQVEVEAESKEAVLSALARGAKRLRARLGESLSSIQGRGTVAREQPTTTSLEAFRQYTLGTATLDRGRAQEAQPFFFRAIELDPNFAMAYARVGVYYSNVVELALARQYITKAYGLLDRVSEHERLYITSHYYSFGTQEIYKSIAAYEQYRNAYPREFTPVNNLGYRFYLLGQPEKALPMAQEANRLEPKAPNPYFVMAQCYLVLNKADEAKAIQQQAMRNQVGAVGAHVMLSWIAYQQEDLPEATRQEAWLQANRNPPVPTGYPGAWLEHHGRLRKADESRTADAAQLKQLHQPANEAGLTLRPAFRDALFGECRQARPAAARALAISRDPEVLSRTGVMLALCGDTAQAQSLALEAHQVYPEGTFVNSIQVPVIMAALALRAGQPQKAVEALQPSASLDRAYFLPVYLRALAYLKAASAEQSIAEFQKILDRRGAYWNEGALWVAAHVGLARAYALAKNSPNARKSYEDFFALWKDADPDVPLLVEARRDYAALH